MNQIEPILPAGSELAKLFAKQRGNLAALADMLRRSGVDHGGTAATTDDMLAHVRDVFDRAVAASPEASVAAYSLGDPALLRIATQELVDWLHRAGLAGPTSDVLDLGCGIGRVAGALAPGVRSVVGVDLSPAMIAEAGERHRARNLSFVVTDGHPDRLPEGPFDLVLAVDSFPYLVQATLADAHVTASAARLRRGGALVILNLSYRGDDAADRADAAAWTQRHGWRRICNGERPFRLWDGAAFAFRSPE